MNKELLEKAVELDKHISQLKEHLQEVKDWAKKCSGDTNDKRVRIITRGNAPDSTLLREKYLCISPKALVNTYISELESEIEELEIKFSNL